MPAAKWCKPWMIFWRQNRKKPKARIFSAPYLREWRNGRRAGLRSRFCTECGFESHLPHHRRGKAGWACRDFLTEVTASLDGLPLLSPKSLPTFWGPRIRSPALRNRRLFFAAVPRFGSLQRLPAGSRLTNRGKTDILITESTFLWQGQHALPRR